ncbi:unnamed protein product [Rotaria sp. Silwood2]|nr:unnamed protein product [Rotaria sp. Silwood2]
MNTNNSPASLYFTDRARRVRPSPTSTYVPERAPPPPPSYSTVFTQANQPSQEQQQVTTATTTTTTSNTNDNAQQQQTNDLLLQYIKNQTDINNKLTSLMVKIDKHMDKQNELMKQMNAQLKTGPIEHSATTTTNKGIRPVHENFMQDKMEIHIDNKTKLKLHCLHQHYLKLRKNQKNQKLIDLLGKLEFNQVVIFVKSISRCTALCKFLTEQGFPAIEIHREIPEEKRLARYKEFKEFQKCILVATNLFERGIDIERVNIVFNYDMPEDTDTYLHRVVRAGRFGTKGLAITYVVNESDLAILNAIQNRFEVQITEMPNEIDTDTYVENR